MLTADEVYEKLEMVRGRVARLEDRCAGIESEIEELQHALSVHLFRAPPSRDV